MKIVITCIMALYLVGCASASYERDGVKIDYKVVGKREFHNLKINPKTGLIELGDSSGDSGELVKLLNNLLELAAKGAMIP